MCAGSARDVMLVGPAIHALAAGAGRATLLCGPYGHAGASTLPIDHIIEWPAPWLDASPGQPSGRVATLLSWLAALAPDEAVIFTRFHQSPLLLRMAGVPWVTAISDDYPGSLLNVRHRVPYGAAETERALSVAAAAGYPPPASERRGPRTAPRIPDAGARNTGDDGEAGTANAAPAGGQRAVAVAG